MPDKIVLVEKNGHANLDSLPFRYGFSQSKDFHLFIKHSSKPFEQIRDNKKRLIVTNARFNNPKNKETIHGDFVLTSNGKIVVTVIRKDNGVEKTLSKALKVFRKYGYVQVKELIKYFHPLYIRGDIKTHQDFKKHWIVKNSDNPEKIAEMESALALAYKELDKERKRADKWKRTSEEWKRKYEELQSKDAKAQPPKPEDEWNPGKYKLADVYWGHQGVKSQDAVILLLCGEDGIGFTVANNWERGLQERFELAKLLVPHNIRYSTWRKDLYSKKWFKKIAVPPEERGKTSEFELKDIFKDHEIPNNGLHTEYYDNGHKMIETNYKDGELDGNWRWWYDNGQLNEERNYKDGKLDGMMTTWLYYGEIESERNYVDGELDGDVTWWNSPTY